MADTERLFFALWPEPALARAIFGRADAVARARALKGTPVPPERMHLTVLFLGTVPAKRLPKLLEVAGRVRGRAFDLELDQVGCFYRSRAYWAGPTHTPRALVALAEALRVEAAGLGLPVESRELVPHVTCLRDVRDRIKPVSIPPLRWPVREFALVRSPEYHVVSHWPLQNARE